MNTVTYNAVLFLAAGCAIIIAGFVAVAYRRKGKSVFLSGRDWSGKKSAFRWDTKR